MIKLAKNSGLTDIISTDSSNPLTTQHPTQGSTVEVKVYLFNDNATKRYESVVVDPVDTTGGDESVWVSLAPDNGGVAGTYLSASSPLTIGNVTTANTGIPFWVKVTTPSVADTQNKTDINLKVTSTEFAV